MKTDPRRTQEYKQKIIERLGYKTYNPENHPMSAANFNAVQEVLTRKAAAFRVDG